VVVIRVSFPAWTSRPSHVGHPTYTDEITGPAVQAQAGHASIESTRIYLHLTDDWLAAEYRRAAELIDADAAAELLAVQEINR
jgi:integrase